MKRILWIALAVLVASLAVAEQFYFKEVVTILPAASSFSVTYTNTATDPWRFGTFFYELPAEVTNIAVVRVKKSVQTMQYQAPEVVTNWMNQVRTNSYLVVTNVLTYSYTNLIFALGTSNATSVAADGDSLSQVFVLNGDVILFSFSTNATFGFDAVKE